MKTSITLCILIFTLCINKGFSQNNFRWADSGAVWHHSYFQTTYQTGYTVSTYTKDTILNGKMCQQITNKVQTKLNFTDSILPITDLGNFYFYKSNDSVFSYRNNQFKLAFKTNATIGEIWDLGTFDTTNVHAFVKVSLIVYNNYNGVNLRDITIVFCDSSGTDITNGSFSYPVRYAAIAYLYNNINEKFGPDSFNDLNIASPYFNPDIQMIFKPNDMLCYQSNTFPLYQRNFGIDCYNNIFTNVNEQSNLSNSFSVYPSPATVEINIVTGGVFDVGKPITVTISNYTGQVVFSNTYNTTYATINVNNFNNGLYIVTLAQQGKQSINKKIMKK